MVCALFRPSVPQVLKGDRSASPKEPAVADKAEVLQIGCRLAYFTNVLCFHENYIN